MMNDNIIRGPTLSPKTLGNIDQSLSDYVIKFTQKYKDKIIMIDAESGQQMKCGEFMENVYEMATFLKQLGCTKGTVVAVVTENRFEYPAILLAALHIGAICTCVNPLYSPGELLHAFKMSKPTIAFTSSSTFDKIKKVQESCQHLKTLINIDDKVNSMPIYSNNYDKNGVTEINSSDTAVILYSSGTTGLSKGVMLMHKAFILSLEAIRDQKYLSFPKDNVTCGVLPMCHVYGIFVFLSCLVQGHTYILMRRYTEKSFLNCIEKYRINTLYIVPTIVFFLSKDASLDNYDLSCVKFICSSGGPLRSGIEKAVAKKLKSARFLQLFGMTETTSLCLGASPTSKPGTDGQLWPGFLAKVIDLTHGSALGPFEKGELCLKGPQLMKGYCGFDMKDTFDSEGWLHTGDVVYYDNDNNFYVLDRIKEIIKYKSFQVPPSELEILLAQLEAIETVGVVGVPDEEAGELPRAYVVKKQGFEITAEEIQRYVAVNVSPQKKLRGGVIFVKEIPKTTIGKLDRKELKKWVAEERLR